jgi:hypothetical protein
VCKFWSTVGARASSGSSFRTTSSPSTPQPVVWRSDQIRGSCSSTHSPVASRKLAGTSDVTNLQFVRKGDFLAITSRDGAVRLAPCQAVGRDLTQAEWEQFVTSGGPPQSACR